MRLIVLASAASKGNYIGIMRAAGTPMEHKMQLAHLIVLDTGLAPRVDRGWRGVCLFNVGTHARRHPYPSCRQEWKQIQGE
jgi:hypothetical protein